jgi:hypothetical protein
MTLLQRPLFWGALAAGAGAYFLLRPRQAAAASPDELLAKDATEQPEKPLVVATPEDPQAAAQGLQKYLLETGKFGNAAYPNKQVAAVQRTLMVADDGIVGPQTRAAARKYGVVLPPRAGRAKPPEEAAAAPGDVVQLPQLTVTSGARQSGATEPEPAQVAKVPKQQKGSIVVKARVKLSALEALGASPAAVKSKMTPHIGRVGPMLAACPGAPQLKGSPSIVPRGSGDTYQITVRWAALWPAEGISPALKSCIAQKAYGIPEIRQRMVPGSLSISRS